MSKSEKAAGYMKIGYNCSQAIVKTYAAEVGLNENEIVKMASVLGGGIGRTGHVCGAVSGAALIIGAKFGSTDNTKLESKYKVYQKGRELLERFAAENKSILCSEILGYDINTKEGLKQARQAGVFTQKCPGFVASAARILESLLEEA
ncbi:MAG TPA: C-GCAxxG-C-C family protein [Smithellaceae bacterium]|nr:C-GCAxxG-C-C family protein [Smithellaceae bacterium]HRS88964.1 C-GCAxxG-C-C family protein [Smithellaceae bacterium]HRV25580.1 C-GCAxxG-C-C family protein [Smithellaceae bacterium]